MCLVRPDKIFQLCCFFNQNHCAIDCNVNSIFPNRRLRVNTNAEEKYKEQKQEEKPSLNEIVVVILLQAKNNLFMFNNWYFNCVNKLIRFFHTLAYQNLYTLFIRENENCESRIIDLVQFNRKRIIIICIDI